MQIKMNKDFLHEYKNVIWKGFSLPELAGISIGLACDGLVIYVCAKYFHIPPDTAVYIGMPAMIPPAFVGMYKVQGYMNLLAYAREIYDTYQCKELSFKGETKSPRGHFFYMNKEITKGGRKK